MDVETKRKVSLAYSQKRLRADFEALVRAPQEQATENISFETAGQMLPNRHVRCQRREKLDDLAIKVARLAIGHFHCATILYERWPPFPVETGAIARPDVFRHPADIREQS